MLKHVIKKTSTKAAIKEQKRVQKLAELKRKERERAYDSEVNEKDNRVIARVYPMMVDYYASAGSFFIPLMVFLLLAVFGIVIYFVGLSIHDNGLAATLEDLRDVWQSLEWNHAVFFLMFVLFFYVLVKLCKVLESYMEHTVCIFTEKHVHIRKFLRKDKFVDYDEIGECIKKRKISIKNGGMKIPYKGGSIHVAAIEPGITEEVTELLGQKYGIWLRNSKFNATVRRTGIGWSLTNLMGTMLLVLGIYIGVMGFMAEGQFTWKYLLSGILNLFTFLGFCSMGIGCIINLLLYFPTYVFFRPHRKYVKVPVSTLLFSLFAVGIVWLGITESFTNLKGLTRETELNKEVQLKNDIAEQFCQDIFGKKYEKVTADELAGVKYFKIYYGSAGLTEIQYSFQDYREFESEEEFEKTVQSWTGSMGYCNQHYLMNFNMFTGLTRIDLTRCSTTYMVFSEECNISYVDADFTPERLTEFINPENVRILHCICRDHEDENIKGIEQYTQLEEFSYYNSENLFLDVTDISHLKYCANLEKLNLECGKAYVGFDELNSLTKLKSFTIDYATLNECTFLKSTPQLEELSVKCGEGPDFSVFVDLPELKILRLTGGEISADSEDLLVLTELEEMHVRIAGQEELENISKLSNLQILDVSIEQFSYESSLDVSCLAKLENLQELNMKQTWLGSATGVEKILEMPKLRIVTLEGKDSNLLFDLYINTDELAENVSIEELKFLNCRMWDMNIGGRAEGVFKEHCKELETFSQEETE